MKIQSKYTDDLVTKQNLKFRYIERTWYIKITVSHAQSMSDRTPFLWHLNAHLILNIPLFLLLQSFSEGAKKAK